MRLVSVNVSRPRLIELSGRRHRSAILKQPAEGSVAVGTLGLAGDEVGSKKHHGGPDQAVYAYTTDDYAWWSTQLGENLGAATFGENLTIEGFASATLFIGDRFRVGRDVLLEVTSPRIPCGTLAGRMGDPQFAKRFAQARRPGPYLRVIATGNVRAGDGVELDTTNRSDVSLLDLIDLFYDRKAPAEALERALAAPVAERARTDLRDRLVRRRAP